MEEPPLLENLVLPKGPLMDEMGQSTLHDWPAKSRSTEEVSRRIRKQYEAAAQHRWPEGFSKWGGCTAKRFEGSGFFRTHNDGNRWWLVDPEGYAFWSAGMDCVRVDTAAGVGGIEKALAWLPDRTGPFAAVYGRGERRRGASVNFLAANFIRAFSPETWYDRWAEIALGELRRLGFNTVANWSDWQIAKKAAFPYVRPLNLRYAHCQTIYRDFPDVFHPGFAEDAEAFAAQLEETKNDPAFIGYFLMNEPTWGFAGESPAAGMLFTVAEVRDAKSGWPTSSVSDIRHDQALADAWAIPATFAAVAEGPWKTPLIAGGQDRSGRLQLHHGREVLQGPHATPAAASIPNHLNLGIRYYTIPPAWAVAGMRFFDVFSMNCYDNRVRAAEMAKINSLLNRPVLVGEWHFGALDVGLPATGIGAVRDQAARGKAFRVYTEDAAAKPWCVGVHYFTLYDESALGRGDGENYNIGFLDVCNRPYEPLAAAARASHERLYQVALGQAQPFNDPPEYLPKLFL